jgi:DNA-3-methyladenine glycosylase II
MPLASPSSLQNAAAALRTTDPFLAPVIEHYGLAQFTPHTDYYGALVNSVMGQQLSVKAAAAIKARFYALFDNKFPSPEQLLTKSVEELRAIGFSNAKGRYVRDLAEHVLDGRITFHQIPQQSNDEIIAALTDVKGIGEWTVHMFLMFCVGRLDVLPTGDLGVRNAVRALYDLATIPTPDEIRAIAIQYQWHPYESAASWYLWRSLDNAPA